jgi:hypothetical protein
MLYKSTMSSHSSRSMCLFKSRELGACARWFLRLRLFVPDELVGHLVFMDKQPMLKCFVLDELPGHLKFVKGE